MIYKNCTTACLGCDRHSLKAVIYSICQKSKIIKELKMWVKDYGSIVKLGKTLYFFKFI
jgi:hypothetical protein